MNYEMKSVLLVNLSFKVARMVNIELFFMDCYYDLIILVKVMGNPYKI